MGCFSSKDPILQNTNDQVRPSFTEYSNFSKYYKYITRRLKLQQFKFDNSEDSISFKKRVAAQNGISIEVAKMWISFYLDYMILATWSYSLRPNTLIYPPYAIQQVARLHTSYRHNYRKFLMIITEGKKDVFYFPEKLVAKQDKLEYYSLRYSYNWAKDFFSDLYGSNQTRKSYQKKAQMDKIWEDFDMTLMQSEFSFNFSSRTAKNAFQAMMLENADEVTLENQEPEDFFRVMKNLRKILGIGELMENPKELQIPRLIVEDFGSVTLDKSQEELIRSINNLEFNMIFVNMLAWEQRISVEEALLWIREYKRFLFIRFSLSGKTKVVPSEPVNQVWRLHMQFTPIYQAHISQIKIKKDESKKKKGTKQNRSEDFYENALLAYEYNFGTPNEKIWPCPEVNMMSVGYYASYYIYIARNCMTEEQKTKTLQKYIESNRNIAKLEERKETKAEEAKKEQAKESSLSWVPDEIPILDDFAEFLWHYMRYSYEVNHCVKTKENSEVHIDDESRLSILHKNEILGTSNFEIPVVMNNEVLDQPHDDNCANGIDIIDPDCLINPLKHFPGSGGDCCTGDLCNIDCSCSGNCDCDLPCGDCL